MAWSTRLMGRLEKHGIASIALIGVGQLLLSQGALAGTPLEKVGASLDHDNASTSTRPSAGVQTPGLRLDLRPPQIFAGSSVADSFFVAHSEASTVPARALAPSASPPASSAAGGRVMSPMESLAHNFHQQGLPLAKLFENRDSLVHLGLNQHGKPGLWILHKLH